MIKLSAAAQSKIIINAFNDELEKNAQFTKVLFQILKGLGGFAKNTLGTKGKLLNFAEQGLKHIDEGKAIGKGVGPRSKFREWLHEYRPEAVIKTKNPDGTLNYKVSHDMPLNNETHGGFIQSHIAKAYHYGDALKNKNITAGMDGWSKNKQRVKNFFSTEGKEYTNSAYRLVTPGEGTFSKHDLLDVGGQKYIGGTVLPRRKVYGVVAGKNGKPTRYIIRKRTPMRVLDGTMTTTGMIGSGLLMGGGVGTSVVDGLIFNPLTGPVGPIGYGAYALGGMVT